MVVRFFLLGGAKEHGQARTPKVPSGLRNRDMTVETQSDRLVRAKHANDVR